MIGVLDSVEYTWDWSTGALGAVRCGERFGDFTGEVWREVW